MTQKQWKEALLRGQGRCIQALRAEPEKYRRGVLWACRHEVAYDPQCEGSRALFVYELICTYPDPQPFLEAAMESLQKARSDGGWKVQYLAELLICFAADGHGAAEAALWEKYEVLYAKLLKKRTLPEGIFPERDDFHMLCVLLGHDRKAMVRIAADIGRLYRTKNIYDGDDFDWLFATGAKRYRKTLQQKAEHSADIAAYLQAGQMAEEPKPRTGELRTDLRPVRDRGNRFPGLLEDYREQDAALLVERVLAVPVKLDDRQDWHEIHSQVLQMDAYGRKAPAELLRHIYETSYCSYCRGDAVEQLGKRKLLTDAVLEECLLDSNDEIRAYAGRILRKRKREE